MYATPILSSSSLLRPTSSTCFPVFMYATPILSSSSLLRDDELEEGKPETRVAEFIFKGLRRGHFPFSFFFVRVPSPPTPKKNFQSCFGPFFVILSFFLIVSKKKGRT
jgi:hypothetical protein